MKINEIFGSIDGEGIRTGELATFIRSSKCCLRCVYCDTKYAFEEGTEMSVDDIISKCDEIGYHNITFTGGEPLIQPDAEELVDKLISKGYNVNIETNGAVDITPYLKKECILTVDYKTPASGMNKRMIDGMFNTLREGDVLKFVMARSDFDSVKEFLKTHNIKAYVYFSPIFNEIEPKELVDFLKGLHQEGFDVRKYRVQVQLHKVIWPPEMRGV